MVTGGASDEVKWAAADRMAFDAENGKGLLKRRSSSIVAAAPKRKGKNKAEPKTEKQPLALRLSRATIASATTRAPVFGARVA